ncbi:MAG: V-type ATP synthase subunit D [Candidatus Omnitrophica bacterium]|nr:V-type ATP synthase subunit D [Candidatus Omnitrophota bacterium]
MRMKVNPTRMELLKLKKRINLAKRGHKLLKEKEEQLLIEFRKIVSEVRKKREKIEEDLIRFYEKILILKGGMNKERWDYILKTQFLKVEFKFEKKRIFNIPVSEIKMVEIEKFQPNYFLPPFYNYLLKESFEILKNLLELYFLENKLIGFVVEIERTRRRVNALEHVLIPNIEGAIKFIQIKLEEYERSSLTTLKHLKLIR